ncbi:MAG: PIG-L deacetylase family protein [Humidesulfovibrio sp.]|nr:PIG-L deacetylase family protein [Humidesulfovibrio sp.]
MRTTPRNVLGIGAHFDDLELGCGGTLAKHVDAGDKVTMLVVTDSEYHSPDGVMVRSAEVARKEGLKAASILGGELVCLECKTFEVMFDELLTSRISALIKERKIDTIYSHWINDLHRDHQLAGRAALMAGRHVPRFLQYRSNYYSSGVDFVSRVFSDISSTMDRKVEAVRAHESELERVYNTWIEFMTNQNRSLGLQIGCEYAEIFEVVRYLL